MSEEETILKNLWIEIAPNGKIAWLHIQEGLICSIEDIEKELTDAGVIRGVNYDHLKRVARGEKLSRLEHIADYILPTTGNDAYIEHLIAHEVRPTQREDGTIDFREINLLVNVHRNQRLARKIPAGVGEPGYLVTGQEIPGKRGRDINLNSFCGEGTEVPPDNPNIMVSKRDGVYKRLPTGKITVLELISVRGNIDYSTGNIHSTSSISISGDVKAGFALDCAGDALIEGLVENALVNVQGNLKVKMGITPGNSPVFVGGILHAMYLYGRGSVTAGEMLIREMISNCNCYVSGNVIAKKIVGGELIAKGDITVEELGSTHFEAKTVAVAGLDLKKKTRRDELMNNFAMIEQKKKEIEKELGFLSAWAVEFEKKSDSFLKDIAKLESLTIGRKIQDEIHNKLTRLNQCRADLEEATKSLEEIKKEIIVLNYDLANSHATISINGTVFAGVVIKIGESDEFIVEKSTKRLRFKLNKEQKVSYETLR
jgi:uncharacterized protein (DUF342 family)